MKVSQPSKFKTTVLSNQSPASVSHNVVVHITTATKYLTACVVTYFCCLWTHNIRRVATVWLMNRQPAAWKAHWSQPHLSTIFTYVSTKKMVSDCCHQRYRAITWVQVSSYQSTCYLQSVNRHFFTQRSPNWLIWEQKVRHFLLGGWHQDKTQLRHTTAVI